MTLIERDTFFDQAVEVGGIHVRVPKGSNRIETLLIRDDKNDVWACVGHEVRV